MHIKSWTKLLTIVLVITSSAFLGFYEKMSPEAVAGLISACLGYVFGNGHGALESNPCKEGVRVAK